MTSLPGLTEVTVAGAAQGAKLIPMGDPAQVGSVDSVGDHGLIARSSATSRSRRPSGSGPNGSASHRYASGRAMCRALAAYRFQLDQHRRAVRGGGTCEQLVDTGSTG